MRNHFFAIISCVVFFMQMFIGADAQPLRDYPYQGIPFNKVQLSDSFWAPRIRLNQQVSIRHSFKQCESTGRIKNFEQAAARKGQLCSAYPFDDSDVYKIMEGASYALAANPDPELDHYLDSLIEIIGQAQESDGYLYSTRTMGHAHPWIGTERYQFEHEHSHELYNVGHLYEAAVAHFQATGKRTLLDIAIRNADHVATVFGPGKRSVAPGHEVIEICLSKLFRVTGNPKYLELAQFFIEARGQRTYSKKTGEGNVYETGEYWQDHEPVVQQSGAIGHAVRAVYLYSGVADVAALTGNEVYITAIRRIWESALRKTYITGGIGTAGDGERFGADYELPNESAYCETCAAIGFVFWNQRMFALEGEGKYYDLIERILYNGLIAGIGLDGQSFFYTNPMEFNLKNGDLSGENKRSPWFKCACCPSNVTRFLPSVPGYVFAQRGNDIYVNLFAAGHTSLDLPNGVKVALQQSGDYPWSGDINITLNPDRAADFSLRLRIPGWAREMPYPTDMYRFADSTSQQVILKINGEAIAFKIEKGYAVLTRRWKKGDKVALQLPMLPRRIVANELVKANHNRVALQRGPLVYCAEFVDNNNRTSNLILPKDAGLKAVWQPQLLNGVMVLEGIVNVVTPDESGQSVSTQSHLFKAIPYFARCNRGEGEMRVWLPQKITEVLLDMK